MITDDRPSVSILICTRNRANSLLKTLESLQHLNVNIDNFEIVVIDNGSTDNTAEVIGNYVKACTFRLRHVIERRPGLSFARNTGIRHSSGKLIMFTDDDCRVAPDWVTNAIRLFIGDPLQIVAGRVELFDRAKPSPVTKTLPHSETMASIHQIFGFLHGANMVFSRSVCDKIGLFDVRLGAGTKTRAGEDTDFVYRAFQAGVRVSYDPDLIIYHDHDRVGAEALYKQAQGFSVGMGALVIKYLLKGQTTLIRPLYWDIRSAIASRHSQGRDIRWASAKRSILAGAMIFLASECWRRSE